MLIRSQDKLKLVELPNIVISIERGAIFNKEAPYLIHASNNVLGYYSSKEKAMKVLDMIEKEYINETFYGNIVFYMPEDSEVIIDGE